MEQKQQGKKGIRAATSPRQPGRGAQWGALKVHGLQAGMLPSKQPRAAGKGMHSGSIEHMGGQGGRLQTCGCRRVPRREERSSSQAHLSLQQQALQAVARGGGLWCEPSIPVCLPPRAMLVPWLHALGLVC